MKRGFTLLELIVVIIIIGLLATLGLTQYTRIVEKARKSEAVAMIGEIRTAQRGYYLQNGAYATTFTDLGLTVPTTCATTHYYYYTILTDVPRSEGRRCTTGGKSPNWTGTGYCVVIMYDDTATLYLNGCEGGSP